MTDLLKDLFNACDPLKAANEKQYVDSDAARGSFDLAKHFRGDLAKVENGFLCFLFSGHLGCGKSSELRHLATLLDQPDSALHDRCYFPIVIDASEYLDENDVTPTDILLSIVAQTSQSFKKIGIELKDRFLTQRLKSLGDVLFSDVRLAALEGKAKLPALGLAEVTARFEVLKRDPTNRDKVRKSLDGHITSLRDEMKLIFDEARLRLRKKKSKSGHSYADFVIILDNLEKIQRIKKNDGGFYEDGHQSHQELFIERAAQLTGLGSHVIYTIPLPLVIAKGTELKARYGSMPRILPMIKIEDRTHQPYKKGRDTMRKLVQKRIGEKISLASVILEDGLDFLIRYSGGNTREFMMVLRQSTAFVDQAPITLSAAKKAISETVPIYSYLPAAYWPKLADLELSKDQSIDPADSDIQRMLQGLMILEYRNGGEETDTLNDSKPWYSVHPILRELNAFKNQVNAKTGLTTR